MWLSSSYLLCSCAVCYLIEKGVGGVRWSGELMQRHWLFECAILYVVVWTFVLRKEILSLSQDWMLFRFLLSEPHALFLASPYAPSAIRWRLPKGKRNKT